MIQTIHFVAVKIALLTTKWSRSLAVSVLLLFSMLHVPCSVHAQIPTYVPTSGLVGWWPFNGNANDESGNGNNGSVNGATLTTDRFGVANKAYNFDGSTSYIFVNPILALTTNTNSKLTIAFWINSNSNNSNKTDVFDLRSIDNSNVGFLVNSPLANNFLAINYNAPLVNGSLFNSTQNYSLSTWYYIVQEVDFSNNSIKLFLNGILLTTNNLNVGNFGLLTNPKLTFGCRNDFNIANWSNWFSGQIDDIAIYNRALTQQEITNLYSGSAPPSIATTASPSLINCGESATLTASSTSAAQPCIKADLPAALQNGLVGYWPFCGNANDESGNGNNGTVNGATLTTDRFGNANSAFNFDGMSNFIEVLHSPTLNFSNSISISFWLNIPDYSLNIIGLPERVPIGIQRNSSGSGIEWEVNDPTGNLGTPQFYMNNGSTILDFEDVNPLMLNVWSQLVGTYDGNVLKLYLNNVLLGSANNVLSLSNITQNMFFGKEGLNNRFFKGKLDDIAIYNRALTATEIQQLYNLGNVSYSWSTGATTPSITVSPAQTTSYSCTATNSSGSTTSSVTVTVADSLSWTGQLDTDWHKPCNWSPQFVPKCCNNVLIPLTSNQPIVSGVAAAEDLTIYTTNGAQLTVNNGANLQIADCPTTITTNACPSLAVLTTTTVSSVTLSTAISGGTITYQGESAITARGICWNTSQNPTIANSFTTNGTGVGTFTSNLTGLTAGTTYYVRAYATNASGTSYGNQLSFVAVNPQPAYPVNSVFCASGPTLVIDVTNPATGKTWMDRNLGATQAATSSTDAAAYGDLYQWGRGSDGHQCRTSASTTTLSSSDQPANGNFILNFNLPEDWRNPQNNNLWQGVNGLNNPCPSGYRIPTDSEWSQETLSFSAQNAAGAFASLLKLSLAGGRNNNNGSISAVNTRGRYWSSSRSGGQSGCLIFFSTSVDVDTDFRASGNSVRCIKN